MKTINFSVIAFLFFCMASLNAAHAVENGYRLRQGDTVQISVWGEASLQKEARVLPDGSISFPLAGRVMVADLTSTDVEKQITEKLKAYFPEPQVTVVVTGIEGTRAYILGKVLKPGPIQIIGPITVLQALSMAGGLDKFAEADSIKVLRADASGQKTLPVHYNKLLQGSELETNIQLQTGDTILVP
jgi:polysaccharide export outer membrane protein